MPERLGLLLRSCRRGPAVWLLRAARNRRPRRRPRTKRPRKSSSAIMPAILPKQAMPRSRPTPPISAPCPPTCSLSPPTDHHRLQAGPPPVICQGQRYSNLRLHLRTSGRNDFDSALGHSAMVTNKARVTANMVDLAQGGGWEGINVDFENLYPGRPRRLQPLHPRPGGRPARKRAETGDQRSRQKLRRRGATTGPGRSTTRRWARTRT